MNNPNKIIGIDTGWQGAFVFLDFKTNKIEKIFDMQKNNKENITPNTYLNY